MAERLIAEEESTEAEDDRAEEEGNKKREAVNLKKIKTALAHKIRSIEKEYRNEEKVFFKRAEEKENKESRKEQEDVA